MLTVVHADEPLLDHIRETAFPALHQGLSRHAFTRLDAAEGKTAWAIGHRHRLALMDGDVLLASALRYDLTGTLDQQRVRICGLAAVRAVSRADDATHAHVLVGRVIDEAKQDGGDLAILFGATSWTSTAPDGFEVVPTVDVELNVAASPRGGAPMTMIRGGEDRDLAAVVAMGEARGSQFRFRLSRDVDLVKHVITRKRLLAGLGSAGARQLEFVIAEEGITAAAYVVITTVGRAWTLEECGDRDPSGARVGAILQALIAREPAECRPMIRGWLPAGFVPPQVTIGSAMPSADVILARHLSPQVPPLRLSVDDVLYWRGDLF